MRVAPQKRQHLSGPAERRLGVDHPVDLAQGSQIVREGIRIAPVSQGFR